VRDRGERMSSPARSVYCVRPVTYSSCTEEYPRGFSLSNAHSLARIARRRRRRSSVIPIDIASAQAHDGTRRHTHDAPRTPPGLSKNTPKRRCCPARKPVVASGIRIYMSMFSWYTKLMGGEGESTYGGHLLIDGDQIRIFDPVPQLPYDEIKRVEREWREYPRRRVYRVIADRNKE
jgi:hypothetical protein